MATLKSPLNYRSTHTIDQYLSLAAVGALYLIRLIAREKACAFSPFHDPLLELLFFATTFDCNSTCNQSGCDAEQFGIKPREERKRQSHC